MNFCLNKQSLEGFLKSLYDNQKHPLEDGDLSAIINGAYTWDFQVSLITYFFTTYLQKKSNNNSFDLNELDTFYQLINLGNFKLQEFDRDFINHLFDYSRSKMKMSLEDILITVQQDLSDNNYESNLRY